MGIAGLLAFFFSAAAPTFSHDVAPILYARCVSCHRDTGVAPFPLVTYAAAAKRARLIATVTAKRYMPPWLPSAPRFQHEMRLSAPEIALLATWASSGAPEGNPRETPPPPKFPDGWPLGAPDLQAAMPPPLHHPAPRPRPLSVLRHPRPRTRRPLGPRHRHPPRQCQGGPPRHRLPGHHALRPQARYRSQLLLLRTPRLPAGARPRRLDTRCPPLPHARRHPVPLPRRRRSRPSDPLPPHRQARNRPHPPRPLFHPQAPRPPPHGRAARLQPHRYPARRRRLPGDRPLHHPRRCRRHRHHPPRPLRLQNHVRLRRPPRWRAPHPAAHSRLEFQLAVPVSLRRPHPPARGHARRNGIHLRQFGRQSAQSQPPARAHHMGTRHHRRNGRIAPRSRPRTRRRRGRAEPGALGQNDARARRRHLSSRPIGDHRLRKFLCLRGESASLLSPDLLHRLVDGVEHAILHAGRERTRLPVVDQVVHSFVSAFAQDPLRRYVTHHRVRVPGHHERLAEVLAFGA